MKITKGTYHSETAGDCEAIMIELNGSQLVIANLSGTLYQSYIPLGFHGSAALVEKEDSKVFPKVTDFFAGNLKSLEINVSFKD